MSAYQKTPFRAMPSVLMSGSLSYLWGSFNDKTSSTLGNVLSDSGNGVTSSVTVQILAGNVPIVSALSKPLITIVGSSNAAGAYNVTNVALTSVSAAANPDAGIYTFQFLGAGNSASAQDSGQFIVPRPEVAEVLVTGASVPVAVSFNTASLNQGKTLSAVVAFPTIPTTAVVTLQSADIDLDSEYADIATVASVTGGVVTGGQISVGTLDARFYRFNTTGITGAGTIVAKLAA
jgi:hypothetical protein